MLRWADRLGHDRHSVATDGRSSQALASSDARSGMMMESRADIPGLACL